MPKDNELYIRIKVDDNGSPQLKRFGRNVDNVADRGTSGFNRMGTGLAAFNGRVAAAIPVVGQLAAGVGVVTGAIGALVVTTANEARQLENMARQARLSTQEFEAYAYAVQKADVSAEQFADMTKDVQDKLGDFLRGEGGEFKDFFENIAPQVGITADELKHLSGPEVLIAVKKALDDTNTSYSEQVTYLEDIANDASKLIPLLEREGEALRKNAQRARELGLVLNDIDNAKLLAAKEATDEVTASFSGLKKQLAVEFAPLYTEIMNGVVELTIGFKDELQAAARGLASFMDELFGHKSELEEQLADYQSRMAELREKSIRRPLTEHEEKTLAVYEQQIARLGHLIELERERNAAAGVKEKPSGPGGSGSGSGNGSGGKDKKDEPFTGGPKLIGTSYESFQAMSTRLRNELHLTLEEVEAVDGALEDFFGDLDHENLELRIDTDLDDAFGEIDALSAKVAEETSFMSEAMYGWAANMSADITDAVFDGADSFEELPRAFAKAIFQMYVQKRLLEPLFEGLGSGSGWLGTIGSLIGFAHGGVPGGLGHLRNQIVDGPHFFAFAHGGVPDLGVVGEVPGRKEGILPLFKGSDGDLGVKAQLPESNSTQVFEFSMQNTFEAPLLKSFIANFERRMRQVAQETLREAI